MSLDNYYVGNRAYRNVVREYCSSCYALLEQLQYMKTHVHVYILQIGKKYSHYTYLIYK